MQAAAAADFDAIATQLFRTPEGRRDPFPLYHRLRTLAPVRRSGSVGAWVLTGYDDCRSALRDPRLQKRYEQAMDARSSTWRSRPGQVWRTRTLLELDGAAHARVRRQVSSLFTPRAVESLRPAVEAIVDELLDGMAASGGGDLMDQLAFPLPVRVIGELLGVPPDDVPPFRERVLALTAIFEIGVPPEQRAAADAALAECQRYFSGLIGRKRDRPADDLISRLVTGADAASPADRLDDDELNTLAIVLFMAGFETTTNLIGSGVLALLEHPGQMSLLREHPERCTSLVDELLRHCGTVQIVNRYATEPVTFGEITVPAGDVIFLMIGAANRDPARYADPDRLDLTRADVHPLSFGAGVHFCLGAALARLEIDVAFRRIAARFDVMELEDGTLRQRDRLSLRGPAPAGASRPAGDDRFWRDTFRQRLEKAEGGPDPDEVAALSALLAHVPLFASCDPSALVHLASTAYPIAFEAGEVLCAEGDEAFDCYVVVEGEATVALQGSELGVVRADDVVGERGLIEGRPRSATVTAATHMLTYSIARDRLQALLDSDPDVAAHMRAIVRARYGPP
jgi:cytochrome P450